MAPEVLISSLHSNYLQYPSVGIDRYFADSVGTTWRSLLPPVTIVSVVLKLVHQVVKLLLLTLRQELAGICSI